MSIRPPTSSDLALLNSLPRTQISLSVRPTAALCAGNGDNKSSGLEMKPEVSIKPAFKLEDESGVLNLSKGSETGWSPPPASPDTMRPSPPRSPQGYRPPSYTSVEICVVCGDRASGRIWKIFPVWLRNRLITAGLEPVLSQTDKSRIVLYPVFYKYKNVIKL